jgi:hypothetical protein
MLSITEYYKLVEELKNIKPLNIKNIIPVLEQYTSRQSTAVGRSNQGVEVRKTNKQELIKDAANSTLRTTVMTQGLSEMSDTMKQRVKKAH